MAPLGCGVCASRAARPAPRAQGRASRCGARCSASAVPPASSSAAGRASSPTGRRQHLGDRLVTAAKPGETPEQALERRIRESEQVEERVTYITSGREWDQELARAGEKLVVLEVQSQVVCQSGFEEEPELQWKDDQRRAMEPCRGLKHSFARTARECGDVVFLSLEADSEEGQDLCDRLGVDTLPSLQFWKGGEKVWEHKGVVRLQEDLGEGVLYYGDTAGGNLKASAYVTELGGAEDLSRFITGQPPNVLTVVNVSLLSAAPCVHIFPAVLSLATNFGGYAAFARLLGDGQPRLLAELDVKQVPTFIFYRNGEEVGRHVGSSRGDLIGQILAQQARHGIQPPPPPGAAAGAQPRPMRRGRYTRG